MMNIFKKIKINNYTYFFIIICLLCGYIKNISIIFFICLFHEFGHIIFIKLFHYEINTIEILPFGGYTNINKKFNYMSNQINYNNDNPNIFKRDAVLKKPGIVLHIDRRC